MKTSDFYYELPESSIAQVPLEKRDSSKLMVLNKETNEIEHRVFSDVLEYLNEGDCLVINETRVIPARIFAKKKTGAKIELLLLKRRDDDTWEVMVRPSRKFKSGDVLEFEGDTTTVESVEYLDDGLRLVKFNYEGVFEEVLDRLGMMPLPPYIHEKLEDAERYQTVYNHISGSAAAPTAGLHFTDDILSKLADKNVNIARLTLHVGIGTFRPVKVDDVLDHKMHSEWYSLDEHNSKMINKSIENNKRIISVGTTSTRTLESIYQKYGDIRADSGWTNIFIYPGYKFGVVDALITNFHLPESTLLMLVSAFYDKQKVIEAYELAVKENYRFFSFGDAMLIL